MFNNKKGQTIIVVIMIAIVLFIAAVNLIGPTKNSIDTVTNVSNLNCTNPNLSAVNNATCIVVDVGFFYFIAVAIAISLAFVSGHKTITGTLTAIFVFVFTVVMITPLKDFIILARGVDHLNCTPATSVGVNMACIFVDLWLFYFIVAAIATAVTLVVKKKVLPKLIPGEEQ